MSNDHFHDALQAHVNVSGVQIKNGHRAINSDTLTEKWLVSPEVARRTLKRTTKGGYGRSPTHLYPEVSGQTTSSFDTSAFVMIVLLIR